MLALVEPSFTYSSPDADTDHFECKLDAGAFATCPDAGTSYTNLSDGSHTFSVRAVDAAGNADASPDARTWTIDAGSPDTTPPDTRIDSGPADGSTGPDDDPAFTYSSPDTDTDHFECKLDAASFATCPDAGVSYSDLADGPHSFQVRAVDGAGNADGSPAARTWTIEAPEPPSAGPICKGVKATIRGTEGDDELVGTPGTDVFRARRGDDEIRGGGGSDLICGGPGDDRIGAGAGSDQVKGREGADHIAGGPGDDVLNGGDGDDRLSGNAGLDQLIGGLGRDTCLGGPPASEDLLSGC